MTRKEQQAVSGGQMPRPGQLKDDTQIQHTQPGLQHPMKAQPISKHLPDEKSVTHEGDNPKLVEYLPAGKLKDQLALITGGDSGIGRAVAVLYAMEGADVVIVYLPKEEQDAQETKRMVEEHGRSCLLVTADVGYYDQCQDALQQVKDAFPGRTLDILVNNASEQHMVKDIVELEPEQVERTFRTNVFSYFWMTKGSLPLMTKGSKIINSVSVVAYRGSPALLDYAATKGAELSLTRSLAKQLGPRGIRVNAVAPGPILTPLQPVSRTQDSYQEGFLDMDSLPLGRIGQPSEVATSYVFLASNDSSYMTGQCLHPNGGDIING